MGRRLPPMHALRAFEAAARTLSFTKAAEEVSVTASAVSQQIRHLEEQLGVKLFKRLVNGLALTDEGRQLLPYVRLAFDRLSDGLDSIADPNLPRKLTLLVLSSFATKWLVPRLGEFAERRPEVEIALFHDHRPPDFSSTDIDLAILWGEGTWHGCDSYFLLDELVFPVCSPKLLQAGLRSGDPTSLRDTVVLRTAIYSLWPLWLKNAALQESDVRRTRVFDDGSMMIDAAIEGQGVALARSVLAADALASGTLVIPFGPVVESPYSYYMVLPDNQPIPSKVEEFMEWVSGAARACSHHRIKDILSKSKQQPDLVAL